jgi:hypothetical protein
VEYIGDENPQYWEDAGGSMARFFFMWCHVMMSYDII